MSANWQSITQLAATARQIDGLLQSYSEQYEQLKQSRRAAAPLDAYSLERLIARLTVARDNLWLYDEQLRRWSLEELSIAERAETQRLTGQMLRLYEVIDATLLQAGDLKRNSRGR